MGATMQRGKMEPREGAPPCLGVRRHRVSRRPRDELRIQYVDADGRQVKETLGREPEWNAGKRSGPSAPASPTSTRGCGSRDGERSMTSPTSSRQVALAARPRKKSTVVDYKATIRNHLRPAFGTRPRTAVAVTGGVRAVRRREDRGRALAEDGAQPSRAAGLMFRTARRWRWVSENPLDLVEKPPRRETLRRRRSTRRRSPT